MDDWYGLNILILSQFSYSRWACLAQMAHEIVHKELSDTVFIEAPYDFPKKEVTIDQRKKTPGFNQ
jgi:hypothetical protein